MEQEEYTKEAIDWSYIEFVDNQDVLDLIEKVNLHLIYIYVSPSGTLLLFKQWKPVKSFSHNIVHNYFYANSAIMSVSTVYFI